MCIIIGDLDKVTAKIAKILLMCNFAKTLFPYLYYTSIQHYYISLFLINNILKGFFKNQYLLEIEKKIG